MTGTFTVLAAEKGCLVMPVSDGISLEAAGAQFGRLLRHVGSKWRRLHVRLMIETSQRGRRSRRDDYTIFTEPGQLRDWLGTEEGRDANYDPWRIYIGN
jgi:hypothetical protein